MNTLADAPPIEQALVRLGLVDVSVIQRIKEASQGAGPRITATLLQTGTLSQDQLIQAWSAAVDLPVWDGHGDIAAEHPFTDSFCRLNDVLPVVGDSGKYLVICDPEDDGLIDMLRRLAPDWPLALYPQSRLTAVLNGHYQLPDQVLEPPTGADIGHLKDLALEAPIIRQVNDLITEGVAIRASDIHLEPFKDRIELRYRVDGVLHHRPAPSLPDYPAVVSRIKILADLDIAERRVPQDGRIRTRAAGRDVDVRVSTIPARHGEDVVLRLLDQKTQALALDATALTPEVVSGVRASLQKSSGLVLVTGPTGSGKTTTLYSAIKEIVDGKRKIITVEDPVEFEIAGISQIQLNSAAGMSFANALRSILRHDPDVIFVGEIRDRETADLAVQSSLTGHLVLSTIHTNNAVGAITRFLEIGVPDYLLASSLVAVTAQRLVRKLCEACRTFELIEPALAHRYQQPVNAKVGKAVGCTRCARTGYAGRVPIAEFLSVNEVIRHQILTQPNAEALSRAAAQLGAVTMLADGFRAARNGVTTIEEVLRVAS